MVDIRKLRYFATVADLASFTKAAAALRIAQPALSRQIRSIEEEFSIQLFVRTGRRIRLTDAGEALLGHAKTVDRDFERLLEDMQARTGTPKGNVVIGIPPTLADSLVPRLVEHVSRNYPLISLRIVEALTPVLADWIGRNETDLAILSLTVAEDAAVFPGLMTEPITAEDMVVVDPIDFEGLPSAYDLTALGKKDLVLSYDLAEIVLRQIPNKDFKFRIKIQMDSVQAAKSMVLNGQASTILPVSMLKRELDAGAVHARPIVPGPIRRQLILAHPKVRQLSQATQTVRAVVKAQLESMASENTFSLIQKARGQGK